MAFAAARCGADVVIASRNMDNCVATAKEIETETGRSAMAYQVHVGRLYEPPTDWLRRPTSVSARSTR